MVDMIHYTGRGVALALGLLMGLTGPALAGHYTHDRVLGFSGEGRYFAFKTYGLQRGSGLPFANLYVLDVARDAWVSGTPLRTRRGEEMMAEVEAAPFAALADVRAELMQRAGPVLERHGIQRPATVIYAAGIGQTHGAAETVQVAVPHPDDPTAAPWGGFELTLEGIAVAGGSSSCTEPETLRGYRLTMTLPGTDAQVLHEDRTIPASRGCPQAYRLDAVLSAGYPQAERPMVALISVWGQGFEGLERNVIALPLPVSDAAFSR